MRIFGFDITVQKAAPLVPVDSGLSRRGWYPLVVHEPYTGAWQRNDEQTAETVLAYFAVYACITLICGDMEKMPLDLVVEEDGIYTPLESPAFSPVLRTPNRYQNRGQFVNWWMTSKLTHGNTYVLKERDGRGVVTALYILDPARVLPLVAPDGSIFYELKTDHLSGLAVSSPVIVPAREIIHDRYNPLFHPLIGVSPLYAAQLPALQGLKIETNSLQFFQNGSTPGGVLTAPGFISQETADRVKAKWEEEFHGPESAGTVAVLGDGLKYEPMGQTALNSQLIEQLKFTAEMVCACLHVDPWMIGIGPMPNHSNVEAMQQVYLAKCLMVHVKSFQACLSDGLELPRLYAVHFDLDDLLLMDSQTKMGVLQQGVGAGVLTPNEARARVNLPPKPGGDDPYLQQQYWPLEALTDRTTTPAPPARPTETSSSEDEDLDEDAITEKAMVLARRR